MGASASPVLDDVRVVPRLGADPAIAVGDFVADGGSVEVRVHGGLAVADDK